MSWSFGGLRVCTRLPRARAHVCWASRSPGIPFLVLVFRAPPGFSSRTIVLRVHGVICFPSILGGPRAWPTCSCVCLCDPLIPSAPPAFRASQYFSSPGASLASLPRTMLLRVSWGDMLPSHSWRLPGLTRLPRACADVLWASRFPGIPFCWSPGGGLLALVSHDVSSSCRFLFIAIET